MRPIILITSNNEKELPDAFLRRCFFHYINFPEARDDERDRRGALSGHQAEAGREALHIFYHIRDVPGLKKKPSTSRAARLAEAPDERGHAAEALKEKDPTKLIPPLHGALLKNEQDVHLFERLAFLARRESRN